MLFYCDNCSILTPLFKMCILKFNSTHQLALTLYVKRCC